VLVVTDAAGPATKYPAATVRTTRATILGFVSARKSAGAARVGYPGCVRTIDEAVSGTPESPPPRE
jgi:hypothetical protein